MSAWIVSKAHIDVLVEALMGQEITSMDPTKIGQVLWEENHKSIRSRYAHREDSRNLETPDYAYTPPGISIPPVWVYAAVACYDYQSCEHAGWEGSVAQLWTDLLANNLHAAGIDRSKYDTGFGDEVDAEHPPWGIEAQDITRLQTLMEAS